MTASLANLSIDLNADLGEGFGRWRLTDDEALLSIVTSANVACGFHAGDPSTMRRVCELAAEHGVRIGAQVSYRDLAGFGRRSMDVPPRELTDEIAYQIGALEIFARAAGARVHYVKPHGALYNRGVHDKAQAAAVVEGVRLAAGGPLPVLGLPGSR
ncbi:LamB/YcsF family protein, partial [Streptomyces sp. 4503]